MTAISCNNSLLELPGVPAISKKLPCPILPMAFPCPPLASEYSVRGSPLQLSRRSSPSVTSSLLLLLLFLLYKFLLILPSQRAAAFLTQPPPGDLETILFLQNNPPLRTEFLCISTCPHFQPLVPLIGPTFLINAILTLAPVLHSPRLLLPVLHPL